MILTDQCQTVVAMWVIRSETRHKYLPQGTLSTSTWSYLVPVGSAANVVFAKVSDRITPT